MSLGAILSEFGSLGPSWDQLGISKVKRVHSKLPFFRILALNGDPIRSQKIILGASRWVSELAMMCFRRGFFRTYILHQIKYPKLIQKDVFFGPLDMAET